MAEPTTTTLAIKAALTVATDKRARKVVGAVIIAVLSPLILVIAVICVVLGGGSSHNKAAVLYAFDGDEFPDEVPAEYREHLEAMHAVFNRLDILIAEKNEEIEEGSLNSVRVKAVFYALHFELDSLEFNDEYLANFLNAFTDIKTIDGEEITFALTNTGAVYSSMTDFLGRIMTVDEKANAEAIYNFYLYGDNIPDDGQNFDSDWTSGLIEVDFEYLGEGNETQVMYFHQADKRWGAEPYGDNGTIASAGCGPTTLAMVVSTLTDRTINPSEMTAWAYENGYWYENGGSYHSIIPEGGRHFGLTVEGVARHEWQKVSDALDDGKLVIALMGPGHFTNGGHFILLRGITSDGKILVADSFSIKRSEQSWELSLIVDEVSQRAGAGGPFWIFS
ncbi:MAG: C39 family peptidase [Oscillospiraceae bacterium]|nr:C39 family peptidase [Oscillospiraceae bacterium]